MDEGHQFNRRDDGAFFSTKELFLRVEDQIRTLNDRVTAKLELQDKRIVNLETDSASREAVERNELMIRRVIVALACSLLATIGQIVLFFFKH